MRETTGFSRVEFQFPPNCQHEPSFLRDHRLQPHWSLHFNLTRSGSKLPGQNGDSMRLKPVVSSVPSKQKFLRPKLRLQCGCSRWSLSWYCHVVRFKLKLHAAESR